MPNRSTRDVMQGTLHRFAQSLGISPRDDDATPPPTAAPPASASTAPKGALGKAADALQSRQATIDKAVDDGG